MVTIMKFAIKIIFLFILLLFTFSCHVRGGDLQEYYVESAGKPGVISFDIATSIFDVSKSGLSKDEKEIYNSIKKLNVVMVPANRPAYEQEKDKVTAILKNGDFEELMSINDKSMSGKLYYIGNDDTIDEVVLFGRSSESGFAVIRILGDKIKMENAGKLMKILQKSDFDGSAFKPIHDFFGGDTIKKAEKAPEPPKP